VFLSVVVLVVLALALLAGSRRRRHGNRVRPDRRLSGDGGWYPRCLD
jgi:hypothetical protein